MIAKIYTATTFGLKAQSIEVEIDLAPALPSVVMVGLPDKAVQESKERIRSSLKESGFEFPLGKVTVNLAPADVIKTGSGFDLPIALGILVLTGMIKKGIPKSALFIDELGLDGKTRAVSGILSICLWAKEAGYESLFVPKENSAEVKLVKGINIFLVEDLEKVVKHLNGEEQITAVQPVDFASLISFDRLGDDTLLPNDFAYIKGQKIAKRALEIAASGGHNVMFIGQPGSGKTLLARSYPTILPEMSEKEVLEVTQIYSIAHKLHNGEVIVKRPFRAPHHSCSHISLVGGGTKLYPGEVSLAHRGVLFLDEFPEFGRESIEALRQPLEDGFVTISRASGSVEYPCRFYLIAAANPTPSGFDINDPDSLNNPQNRAAVIRYQAKFSGPILDRIDLHVDVNRPSKEELQSDILEEKSSVIAQRVQRARSIQTERFAGEGIFTNSEMTLAHIKKFCALDEQGDALMSQAIDKFKLSARSYMRILKLSRTIADLDGVDAIKSQHIAESLQYRSRWNS